MRELTLLVLITLTIPIVWRRPLVGMMIYLGANIVRPEMLFWGGSGGSFIFILYYLLIVAACFMRGYLLKMKDALQSEFLLMLLMLSGIYLSIFFANIQVDRNYYYATELMKLFGICALLYMLIRDFDDIRRLQTVLLGCLGFLGIWGIQQQMLGNERLEGLGGNAWADSNGIAAVYVLFLPVALARIYSAGKRLEFWLALAVAAVMVALIVCTKSRGGLLGLLTCLFSFGFYARKFFQVVKVALVLMLAVMPFASTAYLERIETMHVSDSEDLEGSARSRLILWQAGLMVFADNPILGTGFLTYPEAKMNYEENFSYLDNDFRKSVFRKENKKVTHNSYIQMLSDCGLVGAIPYFLLIIGGIRKGRAARRRLKHDSENSPQLLTLSGLAAGITGFAMCIFFIDSVTGVFFYVQLVISGILLRMTNSGDKLFYPYPSAAANGHV